MADENNGEQPKPVVLKDDEVVVSQKTLTGILEQVAALEKARVDDSARFAGIEEMVAAEKGAETVGGESKLREKKNYEPAFRTVRIRKYPIGGDHENMGYVVGWSNRGAYQKVDRTGVTPQVIDYLDIFFLGHERDTDGKLQAEAVPLLSFLNDGVPVHCKIIETKNFPRKEPTGEEINVTMFDPQHGLMQTGDVIDGYVGYTDRKFVIQIPGVDGTTEIDEKYIN